MSELSKQALKVDNNQSFPNNSTGYITPAILRDYNVNVIDSVVVEETYQPFTQSVLTSIDALDAFTASLNVSFTALNTFTASAQISINALNANTQSVNSSISQLNSFTSSQASINSGYNTFTSSAALSIGKLNDATASLNSFTASTSISITALNASSASQQVSINALNSFSASTLSDLSSIHATTASLQSQLATIGTQSGSWGSGGSVPAGTISGSAQITALGFVSSSVTASTLVTASFNNGTRNLTFTKGDASTFSVNIPDASGSSVPAGTVSGSAQVLAYGIFATTGSNTFNGNQNVLGRVNVIGDALSIQGNVEGSGSQYSNAQLVIDGDPANIYSAFQGVDNNGNGIFGVGINSYNPKDGGAATFWIGGGQSIGGDNTILTANSSNTNLQFWKPNTIFNGNVTVSGSLAVSSSLTLNGSNVVTSAQTASLSVASASVALAVSTSISTQNLQHFVTFTDTTTGKENIYVDGGLKYNPNQDLLLVPNITASGYISASSINVNGSKVVVSSQTGSFATTGSNIFVGDQTISGSLLTNGGAIFGNDTSQYNSLTVSSSLATYPGNLFNSIGIDTDGGGQWSAGMYISTYSSFGSQPSFGLYGGGTGNNGDNNIFQSYGNLVRFAKNTQITGSLSVTGSIGVQSGSYNGQAINNITPVSSSQSAVQNIVTLTASEYAAITPVATTLYIVI
jgi:hypothetical protein